MSADERFRAAVEVVLAHEGGLSEHPNDPGGVTHWGISLAWLRRLGLAEGDIDGDGAVNGSDLAILLGDWGPGKSAADLNGDGKVDATDLALVLGSWTGTTCEHSTGIEPSSCTGAIGGSPCD